MSAYVSQDLNPASARSLIALLSLSALLSSLSLSGCDGDAPSPNVGSVEPDQGFYLPPILDMNLDPPTGGAGGPYGGSFAGVMVPDEGSYGAPCVTDEDCLERLCVASGDSRRCTTTCAASCRPFPDGQAAYCRFDPTEGREAFLCYPSQNRLCQACVNEAQCDGAPCVDTTEGQRCTQRCRDTDDCPQGFSCEGGACLPNSGSCDCGPNNEGELRVCERSNAYGLCLGEERCEPGQGWVGCDAQTPEEETCDGLDQNCNGLIDEGVSTTVCELSNEHGSCEGVLICSGEGGGECYGVEPAPERCDLIDNDCDGRVDEGFTLEDGRYGLAEHCGRCGLSCEGQALNATSARCDISREQPSCVPEACEPGYQLVEGVACVLTADVICEPCTDDSSCSSRSPGAACVQTGDPSVPETLFQVCGRDCSPESALGSDCPQGYSCQQLGEGPNALYQCLPQMGHCLCLNQPEGFSVPCQVASPLNPALTCQGRRGCEGGDFGECVLPDELCDGIDNDCDGVIDNNFRDGEGRYSLDPNHCGRCQLSCAQLNYANAEAICDQGAPTPRCEMRCEPGFVDLENGSDDGCECEIIPGEDLPDGADQNCDGVDGDRARALFVSKTGDDQASGSLEEPLLSVSRALELASGPQSTVRDIYVATGVYSENITLVNGVSLYGGYALDFRERDPNAHPTTLFGRPTANEAQGTITAIGISEDTRVDGLSIYGANATTAGGNSVAIFLINSSAALQLSHNLIVAGNGSPGQRGGPGGSGVVGVDGQRGEDAITASSASCFNQSTSAGSGGVLSCGGSSVRGGAGGSGSCPRTQRINGTLGCSAADPASCRNSCNQLICDPLPPPQGAGIDGSGTGDASGGGPTYDRWSSTGDCQICGLFPALPHLGQPGEDGPNGAQGLAGQGCADQAGALNSSFVWSSARGGSGGAGGHGTGGGGGSAGSGFDTTVTGTGCFDTIGGSGGGGGSGGCGGLPGSGGTGGGGSFAVLIAFGPQGAPSGAPQLTSNTLLRGIGGQGGAGGTGGIGGLGGEGADGGIAAEAFCSEPGGRGGNGGDGGHGGGGGGGCGGISASVYVMGADNATVPLYQDQNELIDSGRAGLGGQGGGSTGRPGSAGASGLLGDVIIVD